MHCTFFIHSSADGHLGSANIVLAPLMCLAWLQAPGLNQELKAKSSAALSDLHSQSRQGLPAVCPPIQLGTCIQAIFLPTTGPLHVTFLHLKCSLEPLYLMPLTHPSFLREVSSTAAPPPGRPSTPRLLGYVAHSQSFCLPSLSHRSTHLTFSLHVFLHHYLSTFLSH